MGRLFLLKLEGDIYTCKKCHSHIALEDHVICKVGIEWIFEKMVNVFLGEKYDKDNHTLKDVYCVCCCALLGFKYEAVPRVDSDNMSEPRYWVGDFSVYRVEVLEPDGSSYPLVDEDDGGSNPLVDEDDGDDYPLVVVDDEDGGN